MFKRIKKKKKNRAIRSVFYLPDAGVGSELGRSAIPTISWL
jgi:hypothetical protein